MIIMLSWGLLGRGIFFVLLFVGLSFSTKRGCVMTRRSINSVPRTGRVDCSALAFISTILSPMVVCFVLHVIICPLRRLHVLYDHLSATKQF